MSRLSVQVVPVSEITPAQRSAMWAIFERYYANASEGRFHDDMSAKDHVFVLCDGSTIQGFSTVCTTSMWVRGRKVVSVFSGDTVIEAAYHGQDALQWAFFRYIASVKLRYPHRTVVWFLISKGYKTYLLLAKNFVNYFPRRDAPTPDWAREVIDGLASARFGDAYRSQTQTLHLDADHEFLRPHVAPVDGEPDPDVRFFAARNPGHAQGDELCCIGVVDAALVVNYPLKWFRGRR